MRYPFIKSLDEEMDHPMTDRQGEHYHYYAKWRDLHDEKEKQGIPHGDDVRVAGYVLHELGIPNQVSWAELDEDGEWVVLWR